MPEFNHSANHRGLFVHVPKCGGLSMSAHFDRYYGHIPALETRDQLARADGPKWKDYISFGFVREPCERLASAYQYLVTMPETHRFYCAKNAAQQKRLQKLSFEDFCSDLHSHTRGDLHFLPQYHWLCDIHGQAMVDHVGRFEHLDEDWQKICAAAGIPHRRLAHTNRTASRPACYLTDLYTPATMTAVVDFYRADYAIFGYDVPKVD